MPSWTSEISDSPSRWISERSRAGWKNIFPVLSPIMFAADSHVRTHPSFTIHALDFMRRSLAYVGLATAWFPNPLADLLLAVRASVDGRVSAGCRFGRRTMADTGHGG